MEFIVYATLALALAAQIFATVRVAKSDLYERHQKISQFQLIWLLPVIGAALTLSMIAQEDGGLFPAKNSEERKRGG